jgi:GT2 family glycosyltransferase
VDVIVPFVGSLQELGDLEKRLSALRLQPGDSLLVVDNTPGRMLVEDAVSAPVLHAADRPTPAFARNRGAAQGDAEWLVFIDADTMPLPDLLDRYFDPPPEPRTGLIGGGVLDEPVSADAPAIARYAHLRRAMSQDDTFSFGTWGYPKSANIACRRSAFEAVGGFREEIRAAEDADLTYRLRAAGWMIERREEARVVHLNRTTLRGLLTQQLIWGAGGAWISRTYPGSLRLARGPGLARWALEQTAAGLLSAARRRDRDTALYALFRPLEALAWEMGRLRSNERPTLIPDSSRPRRGWRHHDGALINRRHVSHRQDAEPGRGSA